MKWTASVRTLCVLTLRIRFRGSIHTWVKPKIEICCFRAMHAEFMCQSKGNRSIYGLWPCDLEKNPTRRISTKYGLSMPVNRIFNFRTNNDHAGNNYHICLRSYITVLLFTVNFVLKVSLTTIMEETVRDLMFCVFDYDFNFREFQSLSCMYALFSISFANIVRCCRVSVIKI